MRSGKVGAVDDSSDGWVETPERVVAAWWDALPSAERSRLGRIVAGSVAAEYEWDVSWCDLVPIGQQMGLHMHYDGILGRAVEL